MKTVTYAIRYLKFGEVKYAVLKDWKHISDFIDNPHAQLVEIVDFKKKIIKNKHQLHRFIEYENRPLGNT